MRSKLSESISLTQLYLLILMFELGSSIVVGIGNKAKQDAWIAVMIATIIGVFIAKGYCALLNIRPRTTLFELLDDAFGKLVGRILSFAYSFYFLFIASLVIRDFCELITTVIFPNTPIELIDLSLCLVIIYVIYLGIEVLGRSIEIFFPYATLFLLLLLLFFIINGSLHLDNLRPVLEFGFGPILSAVFPELLTFPFGETIVFTVILANVTRFDSISKTSSSSVLLSGILLMVFEFVKIAVLGVEANNRVAFPLLSAARDISIANFIERLDALVVFVMMLGIFVKASVLYYCSAKGLEHLTQIPYRYYTFSLGMLVVPLTIMNAENYAEHIALGLKLVPYYMHIPFQFVIPLAVTVILLWKDRRRKKVADDQNQGVAE